MLESCDKALQGRSRADVGKGRYLGIEVDGALETAEQTEV